MKSLVLVLAIAWTSIAGAAPVSLVGQVSVVRTEDQPATCPKVIKRLNEMSARLRELGYLARSFQEKKRLTAAEIAEFSELVRRAMSPNFGRVEKTVQIRIEWTLPLEPVDQLSLFVVFPKLRKRVALQTINWDDANGLLPEELKAEIVQDRVSLSYDLTPEQYCLGKSNVSFDLLAGENWLYQLKANVY